VQLKFDLVAVKVVSLGVAACWVDKAVCLVARASPVEFPGSEGDEDRFYSVLTPGKLRTEHPIFVTGGWENIHNSVIRCERKLQSSAANDAVNVVGKECVNVAKIDF